VARRRLMLAAFMERGGSCGRERRGIALVGALALWVAVGLTGAGETADISGTFGFDVVAVPIPATLVDEIQLDAPGDLTVFKFGLEAELDLNLTYLGASMHMNTAMSVPGLERLVLDRVLLRPAVNQRWFCRTTETVSYQPFLNSVVIPPGAVAEAALHD
jgi:hypothetical protein